MRTVGRWDNRSGIGGADMGSGMSVLRHAALCGVPSRGGEERAQLVVLFAGVGAAERDEVGGEGAVEEEIGEQIGLVARLGLGEALHEAACQTGGPLGERG